MSSESMGYVEKARSRDGDSRESDVTGDVTMIQVDDFQYTTLGMLILHRLFTNRDVKILITSKGNTTGTGKTMLAIILARLIDKYAAEIYGREPGWDAKEHSFMDVYEYLDQYSNGEQGEVLLTDELEYLADRRRSMSNENVFFSQAWQMLRYKNIITIGTAPSMANLDKRIPENTDIWINVLFPGVAYVYYVSVNDWTGDIETKRMRKAGYKEVVRWDPIDDDPAYQYLSKSKEEIGVPGIDEDAVYSGAELEKQKDKAQSQVVREVTKKLLRDKDHGKHNMSQGDIGDIVGRSQQYVSKVKREEL